MLTVTVVSTVIFNCFLYTHVSPDALSMLRSWHQTCWLQSYWTATDGLPMLVIMRDVNTKNVPMVCRCSPQILSPLIFFKWKSVKVIYVRLWNILFPNCGLVLKKLKYLCTSTGFSTASVVNDTPKQHCSHGAVLF